MFILQTQSGLLVTGRDGGVLSYGGDSPALVFDTHEAADVWWAKNGPTVNLSIVEIDGFCKRVKSYALPDAAVAWAKTMAPQLAPQLPPFEGVAPVGLATWILAAQVSNAADFQPVFLSDDPPANANEIVRALRESPFDRAWAPVVGTCAKGEYLVYTVDDDTDEVLTYRLRVDERVVTAWRKWLDKVQEIRMLPNVHKDHGPDDDHRWSDGPFPPW